jgi:type II secretory pathway pseudopilin PulG
MSARRQIGFTVVELLLSLALLLLAMSGVLALMVQNARINQAQKVTAELQAGARNSLSLIVQKLRSAGWDPRNTNLGSVVLDPDDLDTDDADGVDDVEILADLNGDGDVGEPDERLRIRREADQILWRSLPSEPFAILAAHITNDGDGDGAPEPMFVPDAVPSPSRIEVRVTAESPLPDPMSGRHARYTVSSDVVLRRSL